MKRYLIFVLAVLLALLGVVVFLPTSVVAESPPVALMAANCNGCHGMDGRSPGSIPSLAGRPASELAVLLRSFKSRTRPPTIMGRIITPFGCDEIRLLADYFAGLPKVAAANAAASTKGGE